jgi:hypothetical protein
VIPTGMSCAKPTAQPSRSAPCRGAAQGERTEPVVDAYGNSSAPMNGQSTVPFDTGEAVGPSKRNGA